MDLRSIINTEAGGSSAKKQQQQTPVTPVQAAPPQNFREYSQPPHSSPGKQPSQDYGQASQASYASPTAYHNAYPGRPGPPPIQPPQQNDLRSPAASHYSAQSPYQRTPSSSMSGGQYPFPTNAAPPSPAQHSQYPPYQQQPQQREQHRRVESYPQPTQSAHVPHHNSYSQPSQHSQSVSVPQTPPIATQNISHPYLPHQRSQSGQSISTPASAQSQQPQQIYMHDSPRSVHSYPNQQAHHSQQSQPGTPLGPPISIPRQSSGGFIQPSSPYQQRAPAPMAATQAQPHNPVRASPAPPEPQRQPSTPSAYGSNSRSQSERERSLSVSPKTRVPSQTRSIDMAQVTNGSSTPVKRRLSSNADRYMSNGELSDSYPAEHPNLVRAPAKKRIRYSEPPIWAQSIHSRGRNLNRPQTAQANGQSQPIKQEAPAAIPRQNGHAAAPSPGPGSVSSRDQGGEFLGPWERTITGEEPLQEISRRVADWLYLKVAMRNDIGELSSRGVEIEIEAKLGQLINKDTNERISSQLPVLSECVLAESQRIGFASSMTEVQHRYLNDFLNAQVQATHPGNVEAQKKKRVPVAYLHRRERDKFYELPYTARSMLPASIQQELNPRHTVKVRVTHEQKTNEILAKIIKTRVSNLDILLPGQALDCRISINLEMDFQGDVDMLIAGGEEQKLERIPDRLKDRLSYTQSHYQIDLTQVTSSADMKKEHELEVEISSRVLREQAELLRRGAPNSYADLIQGLVDNVRVLARVVPPS